MNNSRIRNVGAAWVSAVGVMFLFATSQQALANEDVDISPGSNVYVSNNSLGQALIYPYYTVRDDKLTIINIFNGSNKTIAAKVRFHESHNSRDVLDFNVVLSPHDKWSGTLSMGATGAIFKTRDNTCTVPQIPATGVALNAIAYSGGSFADVDEDQTTDRMNEGYVEVIAMGQAEAGPSGGFVAGAVIAPDEGNVAYNSTHVNGVPRDCDAVSNAFIANALTAAPYDASAPVSWHNNEDADGNPPAEEEFSGMQDDFNPLRGALTIVGADGVGFGTSALALGDWSDNPTNGLNRHQNSASNHITAQQFPYFLEPTIASGDQNWDMGNLSDVNDALEANTVINEWANNPINGAATDWVIQFPTKAFHVDIPYADQANLTGCRLNNIQAAVNGWRGDWDDLFNLDATECDATNVPVELIAPFESRFTPTGSPVTVDTVTYDKEEREGSPDGVSFSPAQPGAANVLPWESNIITFGGPSVLSSSSPELMLDPVATIPGAEPNGHARMTFSNADTQPNSPVMNNFGLPVIGFVAKERDQGNSSLSYGQIMSHSYENTDTLLTGPLILVP